MNIENPKMILQGTIYITDNINLIMDIIDMKDPNTVVINLDEYNESIKGEYVIQGAELLPPPGAVIAEQDGDVEAYDFIYESWYNESPIQLFITGIIATLYKGKNIIIYYPELNNPESISAKKMMSMFWNRFGIGIGIVNISRVVFDYLKTPLWLNMMYSHRVIGAYEFLFIYPEDAKIQEPEMRLLCEDIRPTEADPIRVFFDISGRRY